MATTRKRIRKPVVTPRPLQRRLSAEEKRPPVVIPTLTPLDPVQDERGRLARAVTYVREVAKEDQRFFGFSAAFVACYSIAVLAVTGFLTFTTGVVGIATGLFLSVFVLPGLFVPLFLPAFGRLWIPLRVISKTGRRDSWVHPKWRRLMGPSYQWRINGKAGVVMNDDKTPFTGRTSRPTVTDSGIFIDLDKTDITIDARGNGWGWEKVDPVLWIVALSIAAFMLLVLLSPDPAPAAAVEAIP
jgi:hypothetical protein